MARPNKFEVAEFGFSWEMENLMKQAEAYPISTDWQRQGITAEWHPHGAGHRFVQGRAYSNGVYRQLVELSDTTWDDCIFERNADGIVLLEHRYVSPAKAAHVANHYGVTLMDGSGKPIPFIPDQPPMEVQQKSTWTPPSVSRVPRSDYNLEMFLAEYKSDEVLLIMEDLVKFFTEHYGNWQVGENTSTGMAYPYFNYQRQQYWPVMFRSDMRVELSFQWMRKREPFSSHPELFDQFIERMTNIFGYTVSLQVKSRPHFPVHILSLDTNLRKFKETCLWFRDVVLSGTSAKE